MDKEQGNPPYWFVHHESECVGIATSRANLEIIVSTGECEEIDEEHYNKLVASGYSN